MRYRTTFRVAVGALVALVPLCAIAPKAAAQIRPNGSDLYPGTLAAGRLAYFASDDLAPACAMLLRGNLMSAAPLFDAALSKDANDLPAYVGWAQTQQATMLSVESRRYQSAFDKGDISVPTRFKLAVSLFYQWLAMPPGPEREKKVKLRSDATGYMESIWHDKHTPIVGIVLAEMLERAHPVRSVVEPMMEQLLSDLSGQAAFRQYLQAKKAKWVMKDGSMPDTPSLSHVRREDLQPLYGVIGKLWSYASTRTGVPTGKVRNGQPVIEITEPSIEDGSKARFLYAWRAAITQAIDKTK